jgi:hypothetical protein
MVHVHVKFHTLRSNWPLVVTKSKLNKNFAQPCYCKKREGERSCVSIFLPFISMGCSLVFHGFETNITKKQ